MESGTIEISLTKEDAERPYDLGSEHLVAYALDVRKSRSLNAGRHGNSFRLLSAHWYLHEDSHVYRGNRQ